MVDTGATVCGWSHGQPHVRMRRTHWHAMAQAWKMQVDGGDEKGEMSKPRAESWKFPCLGPSLLTSRAGKAQAAAATCAENLVRKAMQRR